MPSAPVLCTCTSALRIPLIASLRQMCSIPGYVQTQKVQFSSGIVTGIAHLEVASSSVKRLALGHVVHEERTHQGQASASCLHRCHTLLKNASWFAVRETDEAKTVRRRTTV